MIENIVVRTFYEYIQTLRLSADRIETDVNFLLQNSVGSRNAVGESLLVYHPRPQKVSHRSL